MVKAALAKDTVAAAKREYARTFGHEFRGNTRQLEDAYLRDRMRRRPRVKAPPLPPPKPPSPYHDVTVASEEEHNILAKTLERIMANGIIHGQDR